MDERRFTPRPEVLPQDTNWVDQVIDVTGWTRGRSGDIDWAAAETRLGTPLPAEYKELVARFGYGAFDDHLCLMTVDGPPESIDIVEFNEFWSRSSAPDGEGPWEPYRLYPAPGGLLQWASTERRIAFYWLTEGADPDLWPILVTDDAYAQWHRFDGSTAQFVHRMLTDPRHPYSTAVHFDSHSFTPYTSPTTEEE
ncbi:hypothetical protein ABZ446_18665 [Streptomyces sp. NPDC005813]|uniref:hypothetical protein n=1 Tax=Streptomyces sp. NPDC005813 TaxID=3155592 RepID=UPI0033DE9D42